MYLTDRGRDNMRWLLGMALGVFLPSVICCLAKVFGGFCWWFANGDSIDGIGGGGDVVTGMEPGT